MNTRGKISRSKALRSGRAGLTTERRLTIPLHKTVNARRRFLVFHNFIFLWLLQITKRLRKYPWLHSALVPILVESPGPDKRFLIRESFWTKMGAVSAGAETRRLSDEKNNPVLTIVVPASASYGVRRISCFRVLRQNHALL